MDARDIPEAPLPRHPGRVLRAAREDLAMSVAEVARHLRLSVRQVEAIEADDWEKLPSGPFVRGFVRNYARLLGLDPEPLVQTVDGIAPVEAHSAIAPDSKNIPFPSGAERPWSRYAAIGVLVGFALALLAYEGYQGYRPQVTVYAPPPASAQPAAEASETSPKTAGQPQASEPQAPAPVLEAVVPEQAAPSLSSANPAEAAAVQLQFGRDSWVEIRDREGKILSSQLNAAGSEQTVSGEPPLSLVVGNASAVHVTWRGQPVDLAPYTRVDVARFTLE